jgi:ubiquinone biosynthesis protein
VSPCSTPPAGGIFAGPLDSRAQDPIVSHISRLNKVLFTIAKYRLVELLAGKPGARRLALLLSPYRLFCLFAPQGKLAKYTRLRMAMEELGPIYIKFGQLLSTRRDFLDLELADELQSLQDSVPPFLQPGIESLIETALGLPVSSVFKELETTAFASASVAQVHRARLLDDSEVVVKVLRPGIEQIVADDITLLKWLAELIETHTDIGKRLRPIEVVSDYEKIILDELDLRSEAANTAQLARNFEGSSVLYVPRVYWDFTRKNMLVMERIHGIPVADVDTLNAHKINLKRLAETGVDIFFTQVFDHNFFHADMHPGNIFVAYDKPEAPQYIAIDCAIIGSLSTADQEYLAKNLLAIFKRDYRKVAELHVACGWVPATTRIHEFESAIRSVCEPIFEKPLKDISFGQLLVQLFRTAGKFDMQVQPSLVLLQKTLLNVEGLGRQLYPELDLWQTALPYLENWNTRRLNPLTLLRRVRDNLPNWIDQLPVLPQLLVDAIAQSRQLTEINDSLRRQQAQASRLHNRRQWRHRAAGFLALLAALASLSPPINQWLAGTPVVTLVLALGGAYLLCFKS